MRGVLIRVGVHLPNVIFGVFVQGNVGSDREYVFIGGVAVTIAVFV